MIGPVPAGEVGCARQVERPGRAVELLAAELVAGGRPVLRARAWRIATGDTAAVAHGSAEPLPGPETVAGAPGAAAGLAARVPRLVEWRWLRGWLAEPGPGTVWARQRVPLVAGEEPSPLQRLAVVADSGNGAASPLDLREWLFVNTELTLHLHRAPQGEWIAVDAHDGGRARRASDRVRAAVRQPGSGRALRAGAAWSGRAERRARITAAGARRRPGRTGSPRSGWPGSRARRAVHHLVRFLLAHHRPDRDPAVSDSGATVGACMPGVIRLASSSTSSGQS